MVSYDTGEVHKQMYYELGLLKWLSRQFIVVKQNATTVWKLSRLQQNNSVQ